ncbi:hypothetical protein P7D33_08520 [Lactococcus petauri]|uniref:hypothetical protein n=1 Tax=Lactococcus petauri TaxID=1940789 RepID=UPI00288D0A36|nr:hypothetical protein [Lactococcus petauri]MDT2620867.1 hypothetical protein [Lactococcus petauri]
MNSLEIINAKDKFIRNLRSMPQEDWIEFLNFNRYHHKRPFQEILSLFVQDPDARYVHTFEFWKDFTEETQAQFNPKKVINIYDTNGNLLEQLFDIAQVELSSIPEIKNTVLTDDVQSLIDVFIDQKTKAIQNSESSTITLLLKYNLYEELGILLSDDQTYHILLNNLIYALKSSPSAEKIIEVFELVNELTASLSKRIQNSYKAHLYF